MIQSHQLILQNKVEFRPEPSPSKWINKRDFIVSKGSKSAIRTVTRRNKDKHNSFDILYEPYQQPDISIRDKASHRFTPFSRNDIIWKSKAEAPSKLRNSKLVEFAKALSNHDLKEFSLKQFNLMDNDAISLNTNNDTLYTKTSPRDRISGIIPDITNTRNMSVPRNSERVVESLK